MPRHSCGPSRRKAKELDELLHDAAAGVKWVQLPWAGIEPYVDVIQRRPHLDVRQGRVRRARRRARADAAARRAAGPRSLCARVDVDAAARHEPARRQGRASSVAAGSPSRCSVCSSRSAQTSPWSAGGPPPMRGAAHVVGDDALDDALDGAVGVVLALALTPETEGIIGRAELACMSERGWLVNVARGKHIVTDELVEALRGRCDRRRGARRDRSRAAARRSSAVVDRRTASSRRTWPTRPRWRFRFWRPASPRTCAGGRAASRSSVWSIRPLATDAVGTRRPAGRRDSPPCVRGARARRPDGRSGA